MTTKKIDLGVVAPHKAFYELKADDDLDTIKNRGQYYAPTDTVAETVVKAPFSAAFAVDVLTNENAQYVLQIGTRLKSGETRKRSYEFSSQKWSEWAPKGEYLEGLNFTLTKDTDWADLTIRQILTIVNRPNSMAYLKGLNQYDNVVAYEPINAEDLGTYIRTCTNEYCKSPYILYSIKTNPDTGEIIEEV